MVPPTTINETPAQGSPAGQNENSSSTNAAVGVSGDNDRGYSNMPVQLASGTTMLVEHKTILSEQMSAPTTAEIRKQPPTAYVATWAMASGCDVDSTTYFTCGSLETGHYISRSRTFRFTIGADQANPEQST